MIAVDTDRERCAEVFALRCVCWQNGYRPLAVYSPGAKFRGELVKGAGKRPVTTDWLKQAMQDPPWVVGAPQRVSPLALNTGLLTGELSGLDIGAMTEDVVDQIVSRIEEVLGPTPLSSIGIPPQILMCYRAVDPFGTISTQHYTMPDGSKAHFEILGTGQQVVAFGTHPVTWQPYRWRDRSPEDMPLAELPQITAEQARDLIGEAAAILEAAGGVPIHPDKPKPATKSRAAAELNGSVDQDATESPASGRARPPGAADEITILQARRRRLAKAISADGTIEQWDDAKTFDIFVNPIADLAALEVVLRELAEQRGRAVVRGAPADPAHVTGVRRLLRDREDGEAPTLREVPRRWLAIDVDHIARPQWIDPEDLVACGAVAIRKLPSEFQKAAFVMQATASHGLKPGIRARLWCWLDRPVSSAELKYWFRNSPVDHALFGVNQPIFTANPVFCWGAFDPLPARIDVIPGHPEVPVPPAERLKPPPPQPIVVRRRSYSARGGDISGLIRTVATAARGNRNCALYWAACRVAEQRDIDRQAAAAELIRTALAAGLPLIEARKTVESGLQGGQP